MTAVSNVLTHASLCNECKMLISNVMLSWNKLIDWVIPQKIQHNFTCQSKNIISNASNNRFTELGTHISKLCNRIRVYLFKGSHGIELTWDWTNFLKIVFVIASGGFYSYYNLQCIKFDEEWKNLQKKSYLHIKKTFNAIFKNGFNPVLGWIPRQPFLKIDGSESLLGT